MAEEGTIYIKDRMWILASKSTGGNYRGSTNHDKVWHLIDEELPWRNTMEEAQTDLDAFAIKHGLQALTEEEVRTERRRLG